MRWRLNNTAKYSRCANVPGRSGAGAFTLIELLVVIAIISLLVSVLLPSLQRAKHLAKDVLCTTKLRHIGLAWQFYLDDSNETFPRWRQNMHWFYGGKHPAIMNLDEYSTALPYRPLNPYAGMAEKNEDGSGLFQCPFDRAISHPDGWPGGTRGHSTYDFCGNSYPMNWMLLLPVNPITGQTIYGKDFHLGDVRISLASVVTAGDCQWYYTTHESSWDANFHNYQDKMNLVFLDGHAAFTQLSWGESITPDYSFWPYEPPPDDEP